MEDRLTHIDENGRPRMVDVGEKADTKRLAVAKGSIYMHPETLKRVREGSIVKGDVLSVAQTAGIMAAKNAGMKVCAVYDDYSKDITAEKKTLADYYITDYRQID